jgi:UDP-N-acetylglucosamine acyltransferase
VTVNSGTVGGETTRVGSDCHIMAYSHVAHGCQVGDGVIIANCGTLAGHVTIEDSATVGGLCGIHQFVRVGRLCIVGGCSKLTQDAPPFMMVDGNPAEVRGVNSIGLERKGVDSRAQQCLKQAHRILFRQSLSTSQAVARIRSEVEMCPEITHLLAFVEFSQRGITKAGNRRTE